MSQANLPRFVGIDYSRRAVPVCVLDTRGKILGNRACPDAAMLIDEAVRRFGPVRGATLEACVGAVSAKVVHCDPRSKSEEEDIRRISRRAKRP